MFGRIQLSANIGRCIFFAGILGSISGCYSYTCVTLAVIDRETGTPIQDAHARVWYPNPLPLTVFAKGGILPLSSEGRTDASGKTTLKLSDDLEVQVHVVASGYKEIDVTPPYQRYANIVPPFVARLEHADPNGKSP